MPDILNGDPRSEESLGDPNFDRAHWVSKHGPESWQPVIDKVVEALREQGVTRMGTTGYCFGAPPAIYLALKNDSHVTVLSHPSRLAFPDIFEVSFVSHASERAWFLIFATPAEIQSGFKRTITDQQLRSRPSLSPGGAERCGRHFW